VLGPAKAARQSVPPRQVNGPCRRACRAVPRAVPPRAYREGGTNAVSDRVWPL